MKKVGLIGEAPNDTVAFTNLLNPIFKESATFVTLINDIHGSQLEFQATKHLLRREFESEKPDLVIFIRDLDALIIDKDQLARRKGYFTEFNSVVNKKGIYLLNVFEMEALILADILSFNEIYNVNIEFNDNPTSIEDPKGFLAKQTKPPRKYCDTDNPEIFKKIDFKKLLVCDYFSYFIKELESALEK